MDFTKLEHSLVLGVKVRASDRGAAASGRAASTAGVSRGTRAGCNVAGSDTGGESHADLRLKDVCRRVRRAADLAWLVRVCPSCSETGFVGWQRGFGFGFGEVCGPTGQQEACDE